MKLVDFVPELGDQAAMETKLSMSTGLLDLMKQRLEGRNIAYTSRFGVEMLVHEWVRMQLAYRSQMIQDLYTIAFSVAELKNVINILKNEVFRRGFSNWIPKFVLKCAKCGATFQEAVEVCDKCGSADLRKPDETEIERVEKLMKSCNSFGQSLEEVFRMAIDDINIADDCFLLLVKDYSVVNNEVFSKVVEVTRLHPALVSFDINMQTGLPKSSHFTCLMHRDFVTNDPGKCEQCNLDLVPVMYTYLYRGKVYYLLEDEIIHASYYNDSQTYGWSAVLTIFEKIMTIVGMDRVLYRYFFERKVPSSMIMTVTDDPEGLRREREHIEAQMLTNPDYVPWVAVSTKGGQGRTDLVRLFHTLQEMDYLPIRNEIRDRISATYGVTPVWVSVPSAMGGLSAQTQELQVTSRVVESHQRVFTEKVIPALLKACGVNDWYFTLLQPEEKAEATRLEFMQRRINAARTLFEMGFNVKLRPGVKSLDHIDFEIGGEARSQMILPPGAPGATPPEASSEGAAPPVGGSEEMKGWGERRRHLPPEGMHEHNGHPPHPRDMPHQGTYSRKIKQEELQWKGGGDDKDDEEEGDE
jgi:hypothetical protein